MHTETTVTDECFTCNRSTNQRVTRKRGQIVEIYCTECGAADSFPYDDEE